MPGRPGVFSKLVGAEKAHVLNSFNRSRMQIGGEFGVAINRKAFL